MDYKIVTIANRRPAEPYYCFDEFFRSLNGEQVFILGSQPGQYNGLGSKPRLLYEAIVGGLFNDVKHLIFCDCFDLVFAKPPMFLFNRYKEFRSPLVISSEKNCFPADLKYKFDERHKGDSPYKYLNSGMIVGEVEAMLAVLESMDAKNIPSDHWDEEKNCMVNPNDQEYYQHEYIKQPVPIALDTYQVLCNTLHDVTIDELDFSEEAIANKTTKTYPCSFHLNGGAKTGGLREPILEHLKLI
jgi:hypothetical protein